MKSIITVTPNPALDLNGVVRRVVPDEKNYVHGEIRYPGGNGINAARIIYRLGFPVVATGFLGGGIGEEILNLLHKEGLRTNFVKIREDTRIGVTISQLGSHIQTRLSFSGPTIQAAESSRLKRMLKKTVGKRLIVFGGSLPKGFNSQTVARLVRELNIRGHRCVVDMPGDALKEVCKNEVYLIKPNLIEFQELVGKNVSSINSVVREAQKLTKKVKWICVSSVEGGAVLVNSTNAWFGAITKIKPRSTVGAGDSMVGAMSATLAHTQASASNEGVSRDLQLGEELLRWALAAASATLRVEGTQLGQRREILAAMKHIKIQKLF